MTIERTGMSRRRLLTTAAVGVPAMGALGAVNLLGAPAAKAAKLTVDGVWGGRTSEALEYFLSYIFYQRKVNSLNQHGWIRSQPASRAAENPGLGSGWVWVPDGQADGSATIIAMQRWLGAGEDGLIGPATIRAPQAHYGQGPDGVLDSASPPLPPLQALSHPHPQSV